MFILEIYTAFNKWERRLIGLLEGMGLVILHRAGARAAPANIDELVMLSLVIARWTNAQQRVRSRLRVNLSQAP